MWLRAIWGWLARTRLSPERDLNAEESSTDEPHEQTSVLIGTFFSCRARGSNPGPPDIVTLQWPLYTISTRLIFPKIHRNLLFFPRSGIEPGTSGNKEIAMTTTPSEHGRVESKTIPSFFTRLLGNCADLHMQITDLGLDHLVVLKVLFYLKFYFS